MKKLKNGKMYLVNEFDYDKRKKKGFRCSSFDSIELRVKN